MDTICELNLSNQIKGENNVLLWYWPLVVRMLDGVVVLLHIMYG